MSPACSPPEGPPAAAARCPGSAIRTGLLGCLLPWASRRAAPGWAASLPALPLSLSGLPAGVSRGMSHRCLSPDVALWAACRSDAVRVKLLTATYFPSQGGVQI